METTDKPESAESSNKSEQSEVTPFKNNETNIPSSDKIAETTVNNQPKEEELADNSV